MANEDLLIRIDATVEKLRRELRKGDQSVADFKSKTERSLAGIDTAFNNLGRGLSTINGLLGAIGVGVGVGALANLGHSALELWALLAQKLGPAAATEHVQRLVDWMPKPHGQA